MHKITVPKGANTRLGHYSDTRTVRILNITAHDGLVLIANGEGVADIRGGEAASSFVTGPILLNNNNSTEDIDVVWTVF